MTALESVGLTAHSSAQISPASVFHAARPPATWARGIAARAPASRPCLKGCFLTGYERPLVSRQLDPAHELNTRGFRALTCLRCSHDVRNSGHGASDSKAGVRSVSAGEGLRVVSLPWVMRPPRRSHLHRARCYEHRDCTVNTPSQAPRSDFASSTVLVADRSGNSLIASRPPSRLSMSGRARHPTKRTVYQSDDWLRMRNH